MRVEVKLNGPLKSESLFTYLLSTLNCKILPKSIGGNTLLPKFYHKLENILLKIKQNNTSLYNSFNLKNLNGYLFLISIKHFLDSNSESHYNLFITKVELNFDEKESICNIIPVESHSLTSNTLDDINIKYLNFIKLEKNGFVDNFFGKIILNTDSDHSEIFSTINSITFNSNFNDLISGDEELDGFLFNIWPSYDYSLLNGTINIDSNFIGATNSRYWLPVLKLKIEGKVFDYLKSDIMLLPNHITSSNYPNLDHDSDFSEYSETEDDKTPFDFSSQEFLIFFNNVNKIINDLGGTVLPYLNESYLQDASWIINNSTICKDLRDIVLLIKGSTSWQKDNEFECTLSLFKVKFFEHSIQLRCFMYEGEVVCISQLFLNNVYDYLLKPEEYSNLVNKILKFHNEHVKTICPKHILNYMIDLYVLNKSYEIYIMNISNWIFNPETLLSWEELYEYCTSGKKFIQSQNIKFIYYNEVSLCILTSNRLSRHNLYKFCPEDVEEMSKIIST